jgi:hypothetical protein
MANRTCTFEDCTNPHYGRGLCRRHWVRDRYAGTPAGIRARHKTPEQAFAANRTNDGDCIVWTGTIQANGYGNLMVDGAKMLVHRYSWQRVNGPIPDGMFLDHICHRPSCVKVEHLRLATPKQNVENVRGARSHNRSSGILGVSWDKARGKWQAQVKHFGKSYYLGRFDDPVKAGEAVRLKRVELFTHNDHDRAA